MSCKVTRRGFTVTTTATPSKPYWELLVILSSIIRSVGFLIPVFPHSALSVYFEESYLIRDGQ